MWIITPLGFFSIVQKTDDVARGTLTVRARVRGDLEALQAFALPGLGKITESKSTDYRFRATALRSQVEAGMAKLAQQLSYSNFKDQVAKVQGPVRADVYHHIWYLLHGMQDDPAYEVKPEIVRVSKVSVPKANAYGGVLFDSHGRTLLREPAGHYGGYVWTFAKGKPEVGESPEQTALREVFEETGYTCRVIGAVSKAFAGSSKSTTSFFLMEPTAEQGKFSDETRQTMWVDVEEARRLIQMTTVPGGVARDLAVLDAAVSAHSLLSSDNSDRA